MSVVLALVIAISFVATLIRSTFGFGESLVAVPLFALLLPLEVAVPLSVLMSVWWCRTARRSTSTARSG